MRADSTSDVSLRGNFCGVVSGVGLRETEELFEYISTLRERFKAKMEVDDADSEPIGEIQCGSFMICTI